MSDDELKEASAEYQVMPADSPFKEMADEIYRERVLRARQMSAEEKILAGEELFEWASSITLAGIHNENPGMSEEECRAVLEKRLASREEREREERKR